MNNINSIKSANDVTIATIGSHTALQILRGAKDEGFRTAVICKKEMTPVYKSFGAADRIIEIKDYNDFFSLEKELQNTIIIPHASFVAYMDLEKLEKMDVLYYGNRQILGWESDRNKEREWLNIAGLKTPLIFSNPEDIDRAVIVKLFGAGGGKGYFVIHKTDDFYKKIEHVKGKKYILQEYIVGVPLYAHYFYSRMKNELEIMGFDKRYESNVDSIGRIAAKDQINLELETSYNIVGNIPVVIRESLMPKFFEMGWKVVESSKEMGGIHGPFCLETIVTPELDIYIFEISARIVAGTNPFANSSPYTYMKYGQNISTGRRISMEIKEAIRERRLNEILG
jgi:5-formaminoimidazole-4-carboxamide-1-(beta)-D-ribofuranosyl 5'-monophosphate synthetase